MTRSAGASGTELSQRGLRGRDGRKESLTCGDSECSPTHSLSLGYHGSNIPTRLAHCWLGCGPLRYPSTPPKKPWPGKGREWSESYVLSDLDLPGRSTAQKSALSILGTSPSPLRPCGEQTRWQEHRRCHLNLETEVL